MAAVEEAANAATEQDWIDLSGDGGVLKKARGPALACCAYNPRIPVYELDSSVVPPAR